MLRIPLANIGEDGVDIDAVVVVDELRPEGVEALPVAEAQVSGTLEEVGGDFLFQGNITGSFESTCDRCLKPAALPFDLEVAWNFERDPKGAFEEAGLKFDEDVDLSDSAVCRPIVGDEIDLGPHVWEELGLAVPFKFLCREDCPGLCAACGADLNLGDCGCPPAEQVEGSGDGVRAFAGLAALLPELTGEKAAETKAPKAGDN
nr:COG1399 protein [uncultured bacterium]